MASKVWMLYPIKGRVGIYRIRHDVSGKVYIGSAADLGRRCSEHYRELSRGDHSNEHLQRAWTKHGAKAFSLTVLLYCRADDLLWFEQRALDVYRKNLGERMVYNQAPIAGSQLHLKHSDATRAKMRAHNSRHFLGKTHSEETRQRIAELSRLRWKDPSYRAKYEGRACSEETKRKIGLANSGKCRSKTVRERISRALQGKVVSTETKMKLALSPRFLGHHHSAETRSRLSARFRGRTFSIETRKKISEGVIQAKKRQVSPMLMICGMRVV